MTNQRSNEIIKTRFLDQCIERGIAFLYIVSSKKKNVRTIYLYQLT